MANPQALQFFVTLAEKLKRRGAENTEERKND